MEGKAFYELHQPKTKAGKRRISREINKNIEEKYKI